MGKFSRTGKRSDVFAHLATKFKEEEEQPNQIPTRIPADTTVQSETFAGQPLTGQVTSQTTSSTEDPAGTYDHDEKEGNGRGEKGDGEGGDENVQEPIVELFEGNELEVVDVDEEDGLVKVKGKLVESAAKVVEEFQIEERKRKGKQTATPGTKWKPDQALKVVVIREPIEDLTLLPYCQTGEQGSEAMETSDDEGVYEKLEVKLDQKLLEAMVYFKDPKM